MLTAEGISLKELLEGKSQETIMKLCKPNPNLDLDKVYAESQKVEAPRYSTSIEGYPDDWSLGYKMHAAHTRSLFPAELANPDIETHLDDIIVKPKHSKEYFTDRIIRLRRDGFISESTASELAHKANHLDDPNAQEEILELWEEYKEEKLSKPEKRLQQLKEQQRKDWRQEPKERTQQRRERLNPYPSAGEIPPLEAVIKRFRVRLDDGPYTQEEDFVREDVPF